MRWRDRTFADLEDFAIEVLTDIRRAIIERRYPAVSDHDVIVLGPDDLSGRVVDVLHGRSDNRRRLLAELHHQAIFVALLLRALDDLDGVGRAPAVGVRLADRFLYDTHLTRAEVLDEGLKQIAGRTEWAFLRVLPHRRLSRVVDERPGDGG